MTEIQTLELEAPLGGEAEHEAEAVLCVREVELGEVGGNEDVGVMLPEQLPPLETQPELMDELVREVIEGPQEVQEVGVAVVLIEEVFVPEGVCVGYDVEQTQLLE